MCNSVLKRKRINVKTDAKVEHRNDKWTADILSFLDHHVLRVYLFFGEIQNFVQTLK